MSHTDASDSPTDCPAQHGGAERQQLTDVADLPKRGTATRCHEGHSETRQWFANAPAFDVNVVNVDEGGTELVAGNECLSDNSLTAPTPLEDNPKALAAP